MEKLCQIDNHNKPFALVCTSPSCKNARIFCFKCLETMHSKCLNFVIEINDINKRTLTSSINWVRSEDVKQAVTSIEKFGLESYKENLFNSFKELADKEFGKLTDYFLEMIQRIKKRILDNMHDRLRKENVEFKTFDNKLKGLYNFDALLGILELFQSGEKDLMATSQDLGVFFDEIFAKESQNKEVHQLAKRINALNECFKEFDQDALENFKASIPFQIFFPNDNQQLNGGKPQEPTWTWDERNISEEVALSTDFLTAKKVAYYSGTKQPVLGKIVMADKRYQWVIDLSESSSHRPCLVHAAGYKTILGIIELGLLNNLDDVPINNIIGFSLSGKLYNMEEVHKKVTYKKKKYLFDLDLTKGSFAIADEEGTVSVEAFSLRGKKFVPIAILYCVHDKLRLQVMQGPPINNYKMNVMNMDMKQPDMSKSSFL